jgi:hypothetical protein
MFRHAKGAREPSCEDDGKQQQFLKIQQQTLKIEFSTPQNFPLFVAWGF